MTGQVIAFPKRSIGRTPTEIGLSDQDFQAVCRLARRLPFGWLIERIEDPLGGVTAMLLKMSSDDSIHDYGFVIRREEEYLNLERFEGDAIIPLGIFLSVPMVLRFLRNIWTKEESALPVLHSTEGDVDIAGYHWTPSVLVWSGPNSATESLVGLAPSDLGNVPV